MEIDRTHLDAACHRHGVRLLVLFGSHGSGELIPRPESDVDLAVLFAPEAPPVSFLDLHPALSEAFPGRALDLAHLGSADPLFRWEIMERGELLHGDIDDFLEYRAFAYKDFVDSAGLRGLERMLFGKKMGWIAERLDAPPA